MGVNNWSLVSKVGGSVPLIILLVALDANDWLVWY
jgi:hypothetical protein